MQLVHRPAERDVGVYQAAAFVDEYHDIVVCGVIGQMVLYHDPNNPQQLCQMSFENLYGRMERQVDHLEDHTIICGAGTTGIHVIEEHVRTGHPLTRTPSNGVWS